MSIHLNVTGDNADEFLAQFTALAHALGGVSAGAVAAKLVDAGQPVEAPQAAAEGEPAKPARTRTTKKETPSMDPSSSSGSATNSADETKVSEAPSTTQSEKEPEPSTVSSEGSKPLVFDTDVAPKVVEYVQLLGRDAVAGVLSQFGVQKASQLSDPAQWQELLDALADAKA